MDGGTITAPNLAIWTPEDGWVVENEGVPPDIEVEQTPKDVIAGKDPQLERAIAVALEALKKDPPPQPKRPAFPNGQDAARDGAPTDGRWPVTMGSVFASAWVWPIHDRSPATRAEKLRDD